jgi:hypothetical protein
MSEVGTEVAAAESKVGRTTIEALASRIENSTTENPIILVNPGPGNSPFIYGTSIAREVRRGLTEKGLGKAKIVVPMLYGDRQKSIMLEENADSSEDIYLDEQFGKILQRIQFRSGNYYQHLRDLKDYYGEVDLLLNQRFSLPTSEFAARPLSGGEEEGMSARNIIATIDSGPRVVVDIPNRYYAFPVLLSELLHEAVEENLFGTSHMTTLEAIAERMIKLESGYAKVFIPQINTMSFKDPGNPMGDPATINGIERTPTPALDREVDEQNELKQEGVYVMFSGTGADHMFTEKLVRDLTKQGLTVYSPPWAEAKGATPATPDIMSDKRIIAVFGRSGFGTGWKVQNLAKPWIVSPWDTGEDPEIYFNNKTIEALKLGRVLPNLYRARSYDLSQNPLEGFQDFASSVSPGIQALNRRIKEKFGTLDGIRYVGEQITQDLLTPHPNK